MFIILTLQATPSSHLCYYSAPVGQCDFRFDLFFSFSFSFPVIFSFSFVLVLQYFFVSVLVLPVDINNQRISNLLTKTS